MTRRLTDTEAMMWNLEQNPSLRSTMGSVALLDGPPDPGRLRTTLIRALGEIPALRERVRPAAMPLLPPEWAIDRDFDLDQHLRFVRLPNPASRGSLIDLATSLINDPFDRARPLWQITVITGLPRGRAALVIKLHHSIADGQGALALGASILEFEANVAPPEPIDLADVLAGLGSPTEEQPASLADTIRIGAEKLAGLITDAASSFSHPGRTAEAGGDAMHAVRALADQIPANRGEGSPLWRHRTHNRRFVAYELPLASLRNRAKAAELSINDLFVVACAEAALEQHNRAGVAIPTIAATVVISTRRSTDDANHNAFLPVGLALPGTGADTDARVEAVRSQIIAKRSQIAEAPDLLSVLGTFANLLPTSVASALALDQARRVDFATSNLPGPPVPVWIAGRRIEAILPVGPVAGTAFNATLLSYGDEVAVGFHVDPAAIPDQQSLRNDFRRGLVALGLRGLPK